MLTRLRRFIKNAWRWRKILAADGDWDFGYMIDAVEFKLRHLETHMRVHDVHLSSQREARRIRIALEWLRRYKDPSVSTGPSPGSDREKFNWESIRTPEFGKWVKAYGEVEERAWNEFWALIKKHGRCWWC